MNHFTKTAIIEAFVSLLNSYPLDKITIKDIVDECGVNRSTFYYYFQDIYALLEELFRIEIEKAISDSSDYESFTEGIMDSIDFAMKNKKAIYHIYNSINRENLEKYLYQVVDNIIVKIVRSKAEEIKVNESDIKLITDIFKYALVGLILDWLERGMREDPTDVVKRLEYLTDGNIRGMLERASQSL